jgi:hypothetical protein
MATTTAPAGWDLARTDGEQMADLAVSLAEDLRRQFRYRDELYEDIDTVLFNEDEIDIPEAYQKTALKIHSPYPMQIASTVAAALSVNPATVQFKPTAFGDSPMQNATRRERFFEASWERQQDESKRRLLRLFMYSLATKGEGILKTVERKRAAWSTYYDQSQEVLIELLKSYYDDDAVDHIYNAKTEELKLALPYPIATTDVPPETFYYDMNENGFTSCVEIKQLPYHECLQRFGAGIDNRGRILPPPPDWQDLDPKDLGLAIAEFSRTARGLDTRTITCVEAWDYRTQTITLIGPGDISSRSSSLGRGTLVRTLKHRYGDPILKTLRGPYFHALGITTASRLPEKAGLSVLFGFLRLFPLLNSLLTMQGNAAFMTGFPAFKRTLAPGSVPGIPESQIPFGKDGHEGAPEKIRPGEIYPYDIAAVEMPRAGSEADKLLQNVQQLIKMAMPDVVQGIMSGGDSGYAINQAAHLARLAWDPIVQNAQSALGQRTSFESWLIEYCIGEKVYAWGEQQAKGKLKHSPTKATWLGIGPEDLGGNHHYNVRLDPETPSNKVIEVRALIEQMNARLITYEDAVTENGANPDEVELSWMTQDFKKSPEMQALVKQMTLQKVGTITQAQIAGAGVSQADLMGGQGTPPGAPTPNLNQAGAPPPNPVPMPGQGMPLAPPPPMGAGGGGMPPGGLPSLPPGPPPGTPVVPGVPSNALSLPGQ